MVKNTTQPRTDLDPEKKDIRNAILLVALTALIMVLWMGTWLVQSAYQDPVATEIPAQTIQTGTTGATEGAETTATTGTDATTGTGATSGTGATTGTTTGLPEREASPTEDPGFPSYGGVQGVEQGDEGSFN